MNENEILEDINQMFPKKAYLTVEDIMTLLECSSNVIYNWTKRSDRNKRPPRIFVGTEIRFPKRKFLVWLENEQGSI